MSMSSGKKEHCLGYAPAHFARRAACVALLTFAANTSSVFGLTVVPVFSGGSAPTTNVFGSGQLGDIFEVAAGWWEAAILDSHSITISYSWGPLTGTTAGYTSTNGSLRPSSASIVFDNDGTTQWYMDGTPADASEYSSYIELTVPNPAAGVSSIITGRRFASPNQSSATKLDMITLVAHEIGHALGFAYSSSYPLEYLTIQPPLPKAGVTVYSFDSTHITAITDLSTLFQLTPEALMGIDSGTGATQQFGERKLPSEFDIVAVAERAGFEDVNLSPQFVVSIPPALPLLASALGLAGVGYGRRRGRPH